MEKHKVGEHTFTFNKLTRKDRKDLLKQKIDINNFEFSYIDKAMDEIFQKCLVEKADFEALEDLSIGDEQDLFEVIVSVSRGDKLADSEKE